MKARVLHVWQLMLAISLDLGWLLLIRSLQVASSCGLDIPIVWGPQGSWTSYIVSQGSKSENSSEHGRKLYHPFWLSLRNLKASPFYHILLVIGKSQTCPMSRGRDKDPTSDDRIIKGPIAIKKFFFLWFDGMPMGYTLMEDGICIHFFSYCCPGPDTFSSIAAGGTTGPATSAGWLVDQWACQNLLVAL